MPTQEAWARQQQYLKDRAMEKHDEHWQDQEEDGIPGMGILIGTICGAIAYGLIWWWLS